MRYSAGGPLGVWQCAACSTPLSHGNEDHAVDGVVCGRPVFVRVLGGRNFVPVGAYWWTPGFDFYAGLSPLRPREDA